MKPGEFRRVAVIVESRVFPSTRARSGVKKRMSCTLASSFSPGFSLNAASYIAVDRGLAPGRVSIGVDDHAFIQKQIGKRRGIRGFISLGKSHDPVENRLFLGSRAQLPLRLGRRRSGLRLGTG